MDAYAMLADAIATVCDVPVERVRPETTLDELGVDSLASAEIIFEVEMSLGRELPNHLLRQIDGVRTVGDVADRLRAELTGPAHAS
jgi:acyl carrier protein